MLQSNNEEEELSDAELLQDDEEDSGEEQHGLISARLPAVPGDVDPIILAKLKQQVREVCPQPLLRQKRSSGPQHYRTL